MLRLLSSASVAAVVAACLGLPSTASAEDVVNIANMRGAQESVYFAEMRGWKVVVGSLNGRPAYCAMTKNQGGGELRFGFDGGQWQMAVPASSGSGEHVGRMRLDGRASGTFGQSDGKWTFLWLNLGERDALMNGKRVVIEVGKASIDHDLSGTSAAIRKVEECAERRIVAENAPAGGGQPGAGNATPPAVAAGRNPAPGTAAVPTTATPPLHEKPLGKIGEWEIARVTRDAAGKQLAYCDAFVMTGSEQGLRFTLHDKGSAFGFSGYGSGTLGAIAALDVWFDNDRASASSLEARLQANAAGFEWLMIEEGNDQPGFIDDALRNAKRVSFRYRVDGKAHVEAFPLKDTKRVIDRLIACRDGG